MPLVLDREARERWLSASADEARELVAEAPPIELVAAAVSSWVNDARHDDASCLMPALPPPPRTTLRFS